MPAGIAEFLVWLWLASPHGEVQPLLFPPDNVVLLQFRTQVTLRWRLPGKRFQAALYQGETLKVSSIVTQSSWTVPVSPGGNYTWSVTPLQEVPPRTRTSHFSVIDRPQYHSDGQHGRQAGEHGTNGGQIQAELRRDAAGMNLILTEGRRTIHYLFTEPGVRFLISAKGGNVVEGPAGIAGFKDGIDYDMHCGRKGGNAGWGGRLRIITHSVPWRYYLDVDVSPGTPGRGGPGCKGAGDSRSQDSPDGPPGKLGHEGTVETILEP